MRHSLGLVAVLVGAVSFLACGTPREASLPAPPEDAVSQHLVAAYHPYWTQAAWQSYDDSLYDELYFFSVEIDSTGGISDRHGWPDRWFDMQRSVTQSGVRVTPVVTLFSQDAFESIFRSSSRVSNLTSSLVALLSDSPLAGGLQIDFEIFQPVSAEVRDGFTEFVRELRREMDRLRPGLLLSVYVLAYDESDVYDERALAAAADYLVVQGYDLHSRREGRTGPVAALEGWGRRNWRTIVDRLLNLGVSADKIVMSVPYFGYEWPAESSEPGARTRGAGSTVSYARPDTSLASSVPASATERSTVHGLRRDSLSGSPYYAYEDSTGWRQGWFEDAESLADKYSYVRAVGLRGVAIFPVAYGDESLEGALREAFSHDRR